MGAGSICSIRALVWKESVKIPACRPVIAIGWPEILILVILIAFLLGPTLFKLYRFLDRVRRVGQAEEKKKNKR